MRHLPTAVLSLGLVPGLLVMPTVTPPEPEPVPVTPDVLAVEVEGVDDAALAELAGDPGSEEAAEPLGGETPVPGAPAPADPRPEAFQSLEDVEEFSLLGVTWRAGSVREDGLTVQVRVREQGEWTEWATLPVLDEGPDEGSEEQQQADAHARTGTEPLMTPGGDGVQVRVDSTDGSVPEDLRVELIDPGRSRADGTVQDDVRPAASATAASAAPRIITRAEWGADESLTTGTHRVNQMVKSVVVHHTAGSNSYSPEGAVRELRGIYAYHTKSLGWADIGYNLVLDRYGNVYEGRRGSIEQAIQGAHAGGFNKDTYGVSVMGNFDSARPPAAVVATLGRVVGWKLGQYGLDAYDTSKLVSAGGGTARYPAGTVTTVNAVSGHRDLGYTACPGRYLYPYLGDIRAAAAKVAADVAPTLRAAHYRDWTGDGVPDVIAPNPSGRLWLYPGIGTSGFAAPLQIGRGWGLRDLVTQVGDWDGDGHADILGREQSTGHFWMYRGDGKGGFGRYNSIGGNWRNIDAVLGVGDWDGDGAMDVLARRIDNRSLWLYPGNGSGGWRTPKEIHPDFGGYDQLTAVGDWGRDGRPDFIARDVRTGAVWWFAPGEDDRAEPVKVVATDWSSHVTLHGPGDWDGSGGNDVLAVGENGRLYMYTGSNAGTLTDVTTVGKGWLTMRGMFG